MYSDHQGTQKSLQQWVPSVFFYESAWKLALFKLTKDIVTIARGRYNFTLHYTRTCDVNFNVTKIPKCTYGVSINHVYIYTLSIPHEKPWLWYLFTVKNHCYTKLSVLLGQQHANWPSRLRAQDANTCRWPHSFGDFGRRAGTCFWQMETAVNCGAQRRLRQSAGKRAIPFKGEYIY